MVSIRKVDARGLVTQQSDLYLTFHYCQPQIPILSTQVQVPNPKSP